MFRIGTHIQVSRVGYTHHGIYIENDKVIHYSGFHEFGKKGSISITSFLEFCDGSLAKKYDASKFIKGKLFAPNEIIRRAKSRVGEDSYNLLFNNCESFCNWCTHGDDYSCQTAGTVENCIRSGNPGQAGGLTIFDLVAPLKNLFK